MMANLQESKTQYISEINVSVSKQDENGLLANGFTAVPCNLNRGTDGNKVYLWYKLGTTKPITRIQLSYYEDMSQILQAENYQQINKNLNEGTLGNPIYLLYYKGSTHYDFPIVNVNVSADVEDEIEMFKFGWEKLACDLNRGTGGTKMYLWVKREQQAYVCDITAESSDTKNKQLIHESYTRVDQVTSNSAVDKTFIWYRQTRDPMKMVITDLQVSINDQDCDEYLNQGYSMVKKNVHEGGNPIHIWYKKGKQADGIKTTTVITDPNAVTPYKDGKVNVNEKSLDPVSAEVYLCFYK